MKVLKWILGSILIIALIIITFLAYMGMFSTLKVTERIAGPYTMVYDSYIGDYKETGKVFDKVYNNLKKEGIESNLALGIYHDDPKNVPTEKLRSDCGVVLKEQDLSKVALLKKNYKIKTIDKKMSIIIEFPIKNSLSYMIGPMKAYPLLAEYAKKKGYKVSMSYELYDEPAKKIYFTMPIE